jgi:hypothetical protein
LRRYGLCAAAAAPNTGAVLRYFNADGEKNPRGEAPILAVSVVRVLDTEATLLEHGLKARPYKGLTLVHISAQPEPCLSLKPAEHPTT